MQQLSIHTDNYGFVDENKLSEEFREIIRTDAIFRDAYLKYRIEIWHRRKQNRQEAAIDSGDYDPGQTQLVSVSQEEANDNSESE